MEFEVVACSMMHDATLHNHLVPIARHPKVKRLWIVRPRRFEHADIENARYSLVRSYPVPLRLCHMFSRCCMLARRPEVKAFIGFGAFPYGSVGLLAAKIFNKKAHLGFIGSDWYKHAKGPCGWLLREYMRKADFITATGEKMKSEMENMGFDSTKLTVMPHAIDLNAFRLNLPPLAEHPFVFVGELIRRKRVATILRAFRKVSQHNQDASLCILGDGPQRERLEELTDDLGIAQSTFFRGHVQDVSPYLQRSKAVVMASDREGFPFALVEGMCSGLVPITTPVGTIPDIIEHEENGLLVPRDDVDALAAAMQRTIEDDDLYTRLRDNVLQMRDHFSYDRATEVWDEWLRTL